MIIIRTPQEIETSSTTTPPTVRIKLDKNQISDVTDV